MHSSNTNNVKESSAAFLRSAAFLKRSLTVLILTPLGIWLLALGYPYSLVLFLLLFIGFLLEWFWLIVHSLKSEFEKVLWSLGGTLYISGGVWGFYHFYTQAPLKALILLIVIWATDISAYIVGNLLGGSKLWPRISPKKTWSGSIGGTIVATFVILIAAVFQKSFRALPVIILYIALSIIGQVGDLFESGVKRFFQIKDTGALLPGHGGLLDRFDSTLAVGLVLWLLTILNLYQF